MKFWTVIVFLAMGAMHAMAAEKVRLTLDWKPEPEFGGFYAAERDGTFVKHNLDVTIKSAGEGAPTWKLVATGKTDFATTAADQVLIARAQGADVVAVFAVYQTAPAGIMVHSERGFGKIDDVFHSSGVLAAEDDTWLRFCLNKFGKNGVKIIGYSGGVGAFLGKADYSQQCFIASEPITAVKQGAKVKTFLVADAGYNPYTTVVITRREVLQNKPDVVREMIAACREGWRTYLDDPKPANAVMGKLNKEMDAETFSAAADAQKALIETDETKANGLGSMTETRWAELSKQLVELKVIPQADDPAPCFMK